MQNHELEIDSCMDMVEMTVYRDNKIILHLSEAKIYIPILWNVLIREIKCIHVHLKYGNA